MPNPVHPKTQRMLEGAVHDFARDALRPIAAPAQKSMDQCTVQPRLVVRNQQAAFAYFVWLHKNKKPRRMEPAGLGNFLCA
jgi:hypothetical protein